MSRPFIGLNCKLVPDGDGDVYYTLDRLYVQAVRRGGGIPVLLPLFDSDEEARLYLERVDGVLLTGGGDIDPARWGEPKHPESNLLLPEKEESDLRLARASVERDLPVLGICLGMQILNVACGGSLHQHVNDLPGVGEHRGGRMHEVEMLGDSHVREAVGARPAVNSFHHQAVRGKGEGLRIIARSPDGLIEGIEHDSRRFAAGVQWHPERMTDEGRLFRAFVDACR